MRKSLANNMIKVYLKSLFVIILKYFSKGMRLYDKNRVSFRNL